MCVHLILEDYCSQPADLVLSHIRKVFGKEWKYIGLALGLDSYQINIIELNVKDFDDRAFKMLTDWKQKNANACYCMLISAMTSEGLIQGAEILKQEIKTST